MYRHFCQVKISSKQLDQLTRVTFGYPQAFISFSSDPASMIVPVWPKTHDVDINVGK